MYNLLSRRRELLNQNTTSAADPYVLLPFTIEYVVNGSLCFYGGTRNSVTSMKYNINNTGWVNVNLQQVYNSGTSPSISLNAGDKVQFIGEGQFTNIAAQDFEIDAYIQSVNYGGVVNLSGNVMSLIGGDNFISCTTVPDYCFYGGILSDTSDYTVRDITNLRVSATEIGDYAFYEVFRNEKALLGSAKDLFPNLTTVGDYACRSMFNGCVFLTEPAYIPATDIGTGCYYSMYTSCTRLLDAPDLPATTLTQDCYRLMFSGCTNLATAGEIAATTLATTCCRLMFNNCSKLEIAPVLHATTLASNCYYRLFYGCSKLKYIKAMFTTTPSTSYTNGWVTNVASSGTFVKNSSANWNVTGANGIPSGWTVQTASS